MRRPAFLLLSFFIGFPAAAQEAQVPLDEEGEVYVVPESMEQRLDLFPEVEGFREARLYETRAGAYELVIQYEQDEQMLRERRSLDAGEVSTLRRRVMERSANQRAQTERREPALDQEGRYELLATTTFFGYYEGTLLYTALGDDGSDDRDFEQAAEFSENIGSAALIGTGAGFFIPFILTRNQPVTEAQATLTSYGSSQGLIQGFLLLGVLSENEILRSRRAALVPALLGAGEAAAGYVLADDLGLSAGAAEMIRYGSDYGLGYGVALPLLLTGGEGGTIGLYSGFGLMGTIAGSYVGYKIAQADRYTQGDARIMALSGAQGLLTTATLLALINAEGVRPIVGALMGGTTGGFFAGRALVRDRNFTEYEGLIASLGFSAGGLLGGGLAQITEANADAALAMVTLGALGGFGLTYSTFSGEAQEGTAALRLNVNPFSAIASALAGARSPAVTLRASL